MQSAILLYEKDFGEKRLLPHDFVDVLNLDEIFVKFIESAVLTR